MSAEVLKVELDVEECCVCGARDVDLASPEEADVAASLADRTPQPPLRAMLLRLNNDKVIPPGRLCASCVLRTRDAFAFSTALEGARPPPLSDKIQALRNRLRELTQKIDVFIVVGGGGGAGGAYSEDDIIMVERGALAADSLEGERGGAERDVRGDRVHQCSACPLTFRRMREYRAHVSAAHGAGAGAAHWCWLCGAHFPRPADLAAHALRHKPPAPLHCHLCDTTFQSSGSMRRHEAGCSSTCPVRGCGASFPTRGGLRAHAAVTHAALCTRCFLECASPEERAAHALHHAQDTHFVCGYRACILRFHTRSNLLAHIRKCHAGGEAAPPAGAGLSEAPAPAPAVACQHCPRTFVSQAAMKRHARTHATHAVTQDADWKLEGHGQGEGEVEVDGHGGRVEYLEMETLDELEEAH